MTRNDLVHLQRRAYSRRFRHDPKPVEVGRVVLLDTAIALAIRAAGAAPGKSTPGVDGMTIQDIFDNRDRFAADLKAKLSTGSYTPQRLRLLRIPKAGGSRELGVPTIEDRVVQHLLKLVLEPAVEAVLEPCVFGARPGTGVRDAFAHLTAAINDTSEEYYLVRADIENFFGTIPHATLLRYVQRLVSGRRLMHPLRQQVDAWRSARGRGLPQGAPLSPVLANLVLWEVDAFFNRRRNLSYVRYVDDILLLVKGSRSRAEDCFRELQSRLGRLGLRLAQKKTSITPVEEGTEFLGLKIWRNDAHKTDLRVATRTRNKLKEKLPQPSSNQTSNFKLHSVKAGWVAHYSAYGPAVLAEIDDVLFQHTGQRLGIGQSRSIPKRSRKLPAWMTTGTIPEVGAQPRPANAVNDSFVGQLVNLANLPTHALAERALQEPLPKYTYLERPLNRIELGQEWEQFTQHCVYLGNILQAVQRAISRSRKWRSLVRERLFDELHAVGAFGKPQVDRALQDSPYIQSLVQAEAHYRILARELERRIDLWRCGVVGVEHRMYSQCAAAGITPNPGLVRHARVRL